MIFEEARCQHEDSNSGSFLALCLMCFHVPWTFLYRYFLGQTHRVLSPDTLRRCETAMKQACEQLRQPSLSTRCDSEDAEPGSGVGRLHNIHTHIEITGASDEAGQFGRFSQHMAQFKQSQQHIIHRRVPTYTWMSHKVRMYMGYFTYLYMWYIGVITH